MIFVCGAFAPTVTERRPLRRAVMGPAELWDAALGLCWGASDNSFIVVFRAQASLAVLPRGVVRGDQGPANAGLLPSCCLTTSSRVRAIHYGTIVFYEAWPMRAFFYGETCGTLNVIDDIAWPPRLAVEHGERAGDSTR
jgi:hypothetical protein